MAAYLCYQALLELITQLASIGHHLTRSSVIASWAILAVALVGVTGPDLVRLAKRLTRRHEWSFASDRLTSVGVESAGWIVVVAFIVGVLAYLGWSFLPSNGDSLVYHLVRVEHWIQDRTVAPFPTHYLAQIELSPLAEFNLMHFHLLVGSDHLDGFVQLLACVICIVATTEIARLLGASVRVQVAAAVICATIPSGILAATSTENDYFVAAIGACLVVLVLGWDLAGRRWASAVLLGLGVGLGYLAKGTFLPLVGPVILLLVVLHVAADVRGSGYAKAFRHWLTVVVISLLTAIVIVGPFVSQNLVLFDSPVGPVSRSTLSTHLTARAAAANVIRSTAANFDLGNGKNGFATEVSDVVLSGLHKIFDKTHVDPSNPNYFLGTQDSPFLKMDYQPWDRSGDSGANPWDVALICLAIVVLVCASLIRRDRRLRLALATMVGLTAGYLAFTGTARWSIFNVRYQIPLLVLWSPVIAVALSCLPKITTRLVLFILFIACLPQLFDNVEEPFLHHDYPSGSLAPYFLDTDVQSYVSASASEYESAAAAISESSCRSIGLVNWVFVEYPLWVGLKNSRWHGTIEDLNVDNVTSRFSNPTFRSCIEVRQETGSYSGTSGDVQFHYGPLALSVTPNDARSITARVRGFSTTVPGLRILPGGGWALPPQSGQADLTSAGAVYLFSSSRRSVSLELQGAGRTAAAIVVAARSHLAPTVVASGHAVPLTILPGVTEVQIDPVQKPATKAAVTGVTVSTP